MFEKLKELINNSYCPLSKYEVACIVVCNDNKEYEGVNVENPSIKSGLCAEQVAIAAAISEGYHKGDFKEIHILGNGKNIPIPCFLCRQLLNEFFDENTKVICYNIEGEFKEFLVKDLCPYPFKLESV